MYPFLNHKIPKHTHHNKNILIYSACFECLNEVEHDTKKGIHNNDNTSIDASLYKILLLDFRKNFTPDPHLELPHLPFLKLLEQYLYLI